MRIAQVSPLYERVPPVAYGGVERVVAWLVDGLVARGHDVTLFASGDSRTRARLVSGSDCAIRLIEDTADPQAFHFAMLEEVVRRADEFDIVHFHTDYQSFPFARRLCCPALTTLHWRLDVPGLSTLYRQFADMPVVSISAAQRTPLPWLNWRATVHHGLPADLLRFHETPGDYAAFLGRISPVKRPDRAIEIARRAGVPLRIAAKIDNGDRAYFDEEIAGLFELPHVEYCGEVDDSCKNDFLGQARALLFPIDWPEPFGLVMIEALACGTPVIAFDHGAAHEIVEHGVTGFLVQSVDEAVAALAKIDSISRAACRTAFERRFTVERMVDQYAGIYQAMLRDTRDTRNTHDTHDTQPLQTD